MAYLVSSSEAEEMQCARNETREHALACIDTMSQGSENGCLARIRIRNEAVNSAGQNWLVGALVLYRPFCTAMTFQIM